MKFSIFNHWSEFFEEIQVSLSSDFLDLCHALLSHTCVIPYAVMQKNLFLWSVLTPTRTSVTLPRLLSYGRTGSGKSAMGKALKAIRGLDKKSMLMSGSSVASFRNQLLAQKFGADYVREVIKGKMSDREEMECCLIFDDLDQTRIQNDPILFSILKSGIDRSSSTISIALAGEGRNIDFDVFGLISLSSTHRLWSLPELNEMQRRILIFRCVHYDHLSPEDKGYNHHPSKLLDLDWYDFEGFPYFEKFWDEKRISEYQKLMRSPEVRSKIRSSSLPSQYQKLLYNVIVTGTFLEGKCTPVIRCIEDYFSKIFFPLMEDKSALEIWIEDWIKENELSQFTQPELDCKNFNRDLKEANASGQFYEIASKKRISEIFHNKGYAQARSSINPKTMIWKKLL